MPTNHPVQVIASKQRQTWLLDAHERHRRNYSELHLSSHGLLLQIDVERAFVAGAWASVIVIAQAVIEATIRDLQTHDYETKARKLFQGKKRLERIRSLRNELLHPQAPGSPSLVWSAPNGDFAACHAALERDAKHAVELMYFAIYAISVA
jgi:hypothetical protein